MREELKGYCKELGLDYLPAVKYLTHCKYLLRILRGVFYARTIDERKTGKLRINHLEAIRDTLKFKGVKNWYFGLETAVNLNNLTHEYFTTTFVLSDSVGRPRPFEILGHKTRFIKISPKLFGFGVIKKNVPYSDPEKTLLDTLYLGRYNGLKEPEIRDATADLLEHCSKNKLIYYACKYPKSIRRLVEALS
jgi:predicted transcriptional regulator of viral defense system